MKPHLHEPISWRDAFKIVAAISSPIWLALPAGALIGWAISVMLQ